MKETSSVACYNFFYCMNQRSSNSFMFNCSRGSYFIGNTSLQALEQLSPEYWFISPVSFPCFCMYTPLICLPLYKRSIANIFVAYLVFFFYFCESCLTIFCYYLLFFCFWKKPSSSPFIVQVWTLACFFYYTFVMPTLCSVYGANNTPHYFNCVCNFCTL